MTAGSEPGAAKIEIRPIEPDDKEALARGFDRLSEESRYRRFLSPRGPLTPAELRYFTEVDHRNHEALVAVEPDSGEGVGVARFVRSPDDDEVAEMAVAVADDWQGHGVGSRLTAALAKRAREEGISSFTALALAENDAMLNLLEELGEVHASYARRGTVELAVALPEAGVGRLERLIRAVARGDVTVLFRRLGRQPR
ncbi:MAG TPA: GNAT family N-acetyltransferase [Solirubrobacteraceae bacterium]|jgi:GNAT superfamily N-acetyltransferase